MPVHFIQRFHFPKIVCLAYLTNERLYQKTSNEIKLVQLDIEIRRYPTRLSNDAQHNNKYVAVNITLLKGECWHAECLYPKYQ